MKVVLISPPTPNPSPSYFGPPYGLSILGTLLQRQGHQVRAYDWDRHDAQQMLDDLPRMLREDGPDLVGLSFLSVNRGPALALVRAIKEQVPELPVIAGGAYPTAEPDWLLRRAPFDWICVGDGEETLPELVQALASGADPHSVPGLAFRRHGATARSDPRPPFEALDSLPFPDFELFDAETQLARYADDALTGALEGVQMDGRKPYRAMSALMVLSSRGCVYRCTFCPMSKGEHRLRAHSVGYAVDLIAHLKQRYQQRDFVIGDNLFSWPRERAVALCRELIDRRLDVRWVCMTRADMVDAELLQLMGAAGCREISYGIESFDQGVQRAMKKNLDLDGVPDAFAATHGAGISSTLMLMVGNEGESRASLRASITRAREVHPDRVLVKTTQVFPGTKLWDKAVEAGMFSAAYLEREDAPTLDFVAEVGREELSYLERMLELRTCHLSLPAVGGAEAASTEEAKGCLLLAGFRGEEVVIGGGEPIMRPDFPELLRYALDHRVKRMWLFGDARAMAQASTRRALSSFIHGLVVPLHSLNERRHDEVVGSAGAWSASRKGLLAWAHHGGKVRVWVYLDRYGVSQAPQWLAWLAEHEVSEVMFVLGRDPVGWRQTSTADLPGLSEVTEALALAATEAQTCDIALSVSGLPECLAGVEPLQIHELWRPFDEVLTAREAPLSLAPARMRDKAKGKACERCSRARECEGVWSRWLERDGEDALRPFGDGAASEDQAGAPR